MLRKLLMGNSGASKTKVEIIGTVTPTTITSASTIDTEFEPFDETGFFIRLSGTITYSINTVTNMSNRVTLLSIYDNSTDTDKGLEVCIYQKRLYCFYYTGSTLCNKQISTTNYTSGAEFDILIYFNKKYSSNTPITYIGDNNTGSQKLVTYKYNNSATVVIGGSHVDSMTVSYFVADKDYEAYSDYM